MEKAFVIIHKGKKILFSDAGRTVDWRVKTLFSKEPETIKWMDSFDAGAVFWDIGANIGLYTIYAAMTRDTNTFAFEPESHNYALLNKNISLNSLSNVKAYCIGLSDSDGITTIGLFNSESSTPGGSSSISNTSPQRFQQGCATYRLDSLLQKGLPQPDYVKIDVDGIEPLVVRGGGTVLRNAKSVLIEIDMQNPITAKIVSFFTDNGFTYDLDQVDRTARPVGDTFEHYREFIFTRNK